jgi:hypothetical protein
MTQPLIDADILRWEVGSIGQTGEDGSPKSFEFVASVLDGRIQDICEAVGATQEPILYLSEGKTFRDIIAFTKPYKENRSQVVKPFHFANLTSYMHNQYEVVVADGVEADDVMGIEQYSRPEKTTICTRDKDLRMIPGWHYGWECGKQREYEKRWVDEEGSLEWDGKKLTGTGTQFFYAQMLMGDSTDNIPGCPGIGPKRTANILCGYNVEEMFSLVYKTYRSKGCSEDMILEQGQLLWIVRELDEEGRPVLWQFPE